MAVVFNPDHTSICRNSYDIRLITTDSINQLDIADGLKELLTSKNFTLNMLLDTPVSELAKILGIDNYIASVIRYGARKIVKDQYNGDRY